MEHASEETTEVKPAAGTERARANARILLVDDDDLFRMSIATSLQGAGFVVTDFAGGPAALDFFRQGGEADLALCRWTLPEFSGIEFLQRLKEAGSAVPVIFLTTPQEKLHEEMAFAHGAVDFVDRSRSFAILLNRIGAVIAGRNGSHVPVLPATPQATVRRGDLELCLNSNRAWWKNQAVALTLAEFRLVHHLATQGDRDVPAPEICNAVDGGTATANDRGTHRAADVRTLVNRVRQKFMHVDPRFDRLAGRHEAGYRWLNGSVRKPN